MKLLPNQLLTDLEDGVFKFIDEEFKNINIKSNNDNKDDDGGQNKKIYSHIY